MAKVDLIPVEFVLGSLTKARCSLCGVGFAQRHYTDAKEAQRRMEEFFRRHVEDRHAGEGAVPQSQP